MLKQRTLKTVISATGVGAHTGLKISINLRPAPVNTGIVFIRTDLEKPVSIPALTKYVGDTRMSTTLAKDNVRIATVEHLLSAFAGLGIDNAFVDISGAEVPIMDGSAAPFVFLIQSAGIVEQASAKHFIRIKHEVCLKDGDKYALLKPYHGFKINFKIDFDHPVLKATNQTATFSFSPTQYAKEISRARTFGFLADYEYLRSMNLAQGSSLDNTIVVDDYRVLNEDGLRYKDEFVRHKVLDCVGDLYLLGANCIGQYEGYKSGHALNNELLMTLLADESAYEIITFEDKNKLPKEYLKLNFVESLASA
ncbi:MAG: UDP-3-O-acyl-N-acetylglucosamine deacetylase [Gammaproteobacteria bacterium]